MDFFERAHVARNRDDKHNKDQQATKKQLKLMLKGFKTSNTEIIKGAEHVAFDLDDSTSVSGFSDLNLSDSTIEEDASIRERSELPSDGKNLFDVLEISTSSGNNKSNTESISDISISTIDKSLDSNASRDSSYENDVILCSNSHNKYLQSLTNVKDTLNDSELHSSNSSSMGSSNSLFDPDGQLALQILENLKTKDLKKEKRKIAEVDNQSDTESPIKEKKKSDREVKTKKRQRTRINTKEHDEANAIKVEQSYPSPPFVSITSTDVRPQTFNDILGEYKHSTMRIVPSVRQDTSFFLSNSDLFTLKCLSADITMEEQSNTIHADDIDLKADIKDTSTTFIEQISPTQNNVLDETNPDDTSIPTDEVSESNEDNNYMFYFVRNSIIVVLRHPTALYFHGKLVVQALSGHVEVGGYILKDEECSIIAPVYSYAQYFMTIENDNNRNNLSKKLTTAGLSLAETKDIVTNIGVYDGILLLKPYRSPKLDFVTNNFLNVHLFKYVNRESSLERASNMLGCSLYSKKPVKCFEENPAWKTIMEIVPRVPFKGLACGGKGSGKSTFLRYYVNRLLSKGPVLVIDLDPGQSEFTVAGHVSATVVDLPIFGPSFTHLRTPQRALNIGMISTMDNINRYFNAATSLVSYSKQHFSQLPWVINTMGMTNDLGLQIIALIIIIAEPNFVLQYDSKNPKKGFNVNLSPYNVLELYKKFRNSKFFRDISCPHLDYSLISAPDAESITKSRSLAPRDERYLSYLAYFGELVGNMKPDGWMLEIIPYEVHLKDLYIAVNTPFKDCITKVINGKVVGLCQQSKQCKERVFILSDYPLLCHGHGLVRGIDWDKQVLYIITPLPARKLHAINTLLYADWVPDLIGQEAHLPEGTEVPYRMIAQQHQMELMVAPRRRFNPLQLLKMTRGS